MSYDSLTASLESSRPIELYEFSYQGGNFYFTSADRNISFDGREYVAHQLSHTPISENNEIGKSPVTITALQDFVISELFNFAPPDSVVGLAIRKMQFADGLTAPGIWTGRVISVSWPGDKSQLKCESILSSLKQTGLRRNFSKNCPHVLYEQGDGKCNVDRNDHKFESTVVSIVGLQIKSTTFASQDDTYFAGGYVEWESTPGFFVRRGIKSHVGDTIEVTHPMRGLAPPMTINVYPGCDHTFNGDNGCVPKFANPENYGGFPHFVNKNAFGNSSVF